MSRKKETGFPAALRRELAAAGLSQAALARLAGVSQQAVSDWLGGRRQPLLDQLCKLADALGVTLDRLRA